MAHRAADLCGAECIQIVVYAALQTYSPDQRGRHQQVPGGPEPGHPQRFFESNFLEMLQ